MLKIDFYTTAGCHLCEQALSLCEPYTQAEIIEINSIDIAEDEQLVDLYGIRIPVIKRLDNDVELGWPFDQVLLANFLRD